jgi:outer membrane protein assembly factor BamB
VNGSLYGSWYRRGKGWACLNPATGEVRYDTNLMAKGAVLYADKRLYCLSEEGEMILLNPTETRFEVTGRFRLVEGRQNDVWPHPVILNRRLYLRYHETLRCYDVSVR